MLDLRVHKKNLRQKLLAERKDLNDAEYELRSQQITDRLLFLPEIQRADCIHIFWPILKNREIDTRPLIRALTASGKKCVLPRIVHYSQTPEGTPRMQHCFFTGETNLRANRWDVYEPVTTMTVPVASLDAVIVPALAVDIHGIRLGYGKGFYDEFLTDVSCPILCPVFNSFLKEKLPTESHDIPVDILVTEQMVKRLQRNAT